MEKITKTIATKMLANVPEDKRFWCSDARLLQNLQEMESALKDMSDDTFRYHANETKNDFSTWVKDVIGDEKLAGDLRKSTIRAVAAKTVATRVAFLKSRV